LLNANYIRLLEHRQYPPLKHILIRRSAVGQYSTVTISEKGKQLAQVIINRPVGDAMMYWINEFENLVFANLPITFSIYKFTIINNVLV